MTPDPAVNEVFGPVVLPRDVEEATRTLLATWLGSYLREIERQQGIPPDSLRPIASEVVVNQWSQIQGQQKPCICIISPGTVDDPEKNAGRYGWWFDIGIAVFVEAINDMQAKYLADMYAGAITKLLVDKKSIGGISSDLRVLSQRSDDIPENLLSGGIAAARVDFHAFIDGVVTVTGGPSTPEDDPAPWPHVETVHIDAERLTT